MFNIICKFCNNSFSAKNKRKVYCSEQCKNQWKSQTIIAKRRGNEDEYNAYQRKWRSDNKQHCRDWAKTRYQTHDVIRQRKIELAQQWSRANPERVVANRRAYYHANWFKFQERNFTKRDRTLSAELVHLVMEADNYTCQYCGQRGGKLTIDHKIPVSRHGTDERENLCTACHRCNCRKGAKTVEEFKLYMETR